MKTFRTLALTFLFSTGMALPSCTDDCSCPPVEGSFFSIQNADLTQSEALADGLLSLEAGDTVKQENYRLHIRFVTEYVSFAPRPAAAPFSLINSAYACSCLYNGMEGAKENIESLQLISLTGFGAYQAGDTLNSLFVVDHYGTQQEVGPFFSQKLWKEAYILRLKQGPAAPGALQLKLMLTLEDGRTVEAVSQEVVIE